MAGQYCIWLFGYRSKSHCLRLSLWPIGCTPVLLWHSSAAAAAVAASGAIYVLCLYSVYNDYGGEDHLSGRLVLCTAVWQCRSKSCYCAL